MEKRDEERERINGEEGNIRMWDSSFSSMFSGLDREEEMSVMVSALAHVVAGDVRVEAGGGGNGGGGGGGGSLSACKRGREDQQSSVTGM